MPSFHLLGPFDSSFLALQQWYTKSIRTNSRTFAFMYISQATTTEPVERLMQPTGG